MKKSKLTEEEVGRGRHSAGLTLQDVHDSMVSKGREGER